MHARSRVLVIAGATATGKTAIGEAAAALSDGEIVCADSRQVFRELELGTGKPSPAARARSPHLLFEALALGERASAGWYARAAAAVIGDVLARGQLPILVGGSGLYLKALMQGLAEEPPHDPERRARFAEALAREGPESLHRRLGEVDPLTARRLAPRDGQRVTRALEVWEASGRPLSWWHRRPPRPRVEAEWRSVEITTDPGALRARIARRTGEMFDGGLIEETRALCGQGLEPTLERLRAIGYDEALALLEGRLTRAEAEAWTNLRTARLAKRQRTWFRHQLEGERLDADAGATEALAARALALARA